MPIVYAWMLGPEQIADEVKDVLKRKGIKATNIKVTTDQTLGIRNWDITWDSGKNKGQAHLDIPEATTLSDLRESLAYVLSPT